MPREYFSAVKVKTYSDLLEVILEGKFTIFTMILMLRGIGLFLS